ncbi:three prime repair exonuclease 2 [Arctopsyche grandis]|uniref:three prime repair exonuclease 2 n=1 Tax=Arctopsyche grandis TaxID=121162 RepID=UPI00406D9BFC
MTTINTFIFVDLETSGLPWQERNHTQITEIALVSVKREHILVKSFTAPRVLNKLSLCFKTSMKISDRVEEITGLSNKLLDKENRFNEQGASLIKAFIELQMSPVCIVSHNGCGFDFPILRAEFARVNVSLPDDVLCTDTLQMFRCILKESNHVPVMDEFEHFDLSTDDLQEIDALERKHSSDLESLVCASPSKLSVADMQNGSGKRSAVKEKKPRQSFKLIDVYRRLHGIVPMSLHRAENDCMALLECCTVKSTEFINWSADHNILFNRIPKMEVGVKFSTCFVHL